MDIAVALIAGGFIGAVLGFVGAGGAMLSVPILLYIFDFTAIPATTGALAIAGFSFGAFVTCRALATLTTEGSSSGQDIQHAVLVGTAVSRFEVPAIPPALHERTLVIHGDADDTVLLADVMSWARPQYLPVSVVPDVGHFFHGQLPLLKYMVARHLSPPQAA